jgi:hypothetical protein
MDTLILRALEAMNERAPSSLMLDLVSGVMDEQARFLGRSLIAACGDQTALLRSHENVLETRRQTRAAFAAMLPVFARA